MLGVVRQLQFDRDRDPATLDAAVKLLDQAADDLPEGPHLPTCLGHLGNALLTRFELDDAQHAFERALAATGPRSPRTAALHSSLGLTLLERYRHAGGTLSDALSALEAAVRDGADAGRIHPYLLATCPSRARPPTSAATPTPTSPPRSRRTDKPARRASPAARDRPDHCRPLGGMG